MVLATAAACECAAGPPLAGTPSASLAGRILESPEAILELTPDEVGSAPRATVSGVVTMVNEYAPGKAFFVLQQDDHGIYVSCRALQQPPHQTNGAATFAIRPGDVVEVAGTVEPGAWAPRVMADALRVVGTDELPEPAPANFARLFEGVEAGRRVVLEGTVQGVETISRNQGWLLPISVDGHRVGIQLLATDFPDRPDDLPDAEVRAIGVVSAVRNTRGEAVAPRLIVARPQDLLVTKPAPESPFDAERVPLDEIARFRLTPRGGHRLRTDGIVARSFSRKLFLSEGSGGVCVDLDSDQQPPAVAPGDRVEVAGFLDMSRGIAGLTSGRVRKVASGPPPTPLLIAVGDLLAADQRSHIEGMMIRPGNHDGRLVRCRGRVESTSQIEGGFEVALWDGKHAFSALVPPGSVSTAKLAPGSEVELSGIVQVDVAAGRAGEMLTDHPAARRVTLLLGKPADIVVLRSPPWWTASRLAVAAGALVALLGAAGIWGTQLRREVKKQTARAVTEAAARRQGDLEYEVSLRERNRLAADLHDTILQTVTGIGFQLQACEETRALAVAGEQQESSSDEHLSSAKRMVEHAVGQLRSSVWSLRTLPAAGQVFSEAVRDMVDRQGMGHPTRITITIDPAADQLPAHMAGSLLQILREAVNNSLIHARPSSIELRVGIDTAQDVVIASVADDGNGFVIGKQAGPEARHFGLTGMRERAADLEGSLAIRSAPGAGTTVVVSAPLAGARRS